MRTYTTPNTNDPAHDGRGCLNKHSSSDRRSFWSPVACTAFFAITGEYATATPISRGCSPIRRAAMHFHGLSSPIGTTSGCALRPPPAPSSQEEGEDGEQQRNHDADASRDARSPRYARRELVRVLEAAQQ